MLLSSAEIEEPPIEAGVHSAVGIEWLRLGGGGGEVDRLGGDLDAAEAHQGSSHYATGQLDGGSHGEEIDLLVDQWPWPAWVGYLHRPGGVLQNHDLSRRMDPQRLYVPAHGDSPADAGSERGDGDSLARTGCIAHRKTLPCGPPASTVSIDSD